MNVSELIRALEQIPGDTEVRFSEDWLMLNFAPCETCGTHEGVRVVPTGSLARKTPICPPCLSRLEEATAAFHGEMGT